MQLLVVLCHVGCLQEWELPRPPAGRRCRGPTSLPEKGRSGSLTWPRRHPTVAPVKGQGLRVRAPTLSLPPPASCMYQTAPFPFSPPFFTLLPSPRPIHCTFFAFGPTLTWLSTWPPCSPPIYITSPPSPSPHHLTSPPSSSLK